MPVSGRRLTLDEALALCRKAGFTGQKLITVVALMTAESGRYVGAWNVNVVLDDCQVAKKSVDRGLLQINSIHTKLDFTEAFRAWPNVKFAWRLSDSGTDFTPWMAFVNGKHEQFVAEVTAAWEAGKWRDLVPTIREQLGD